MSKEENNLSEKFTVIEQMPRFPGCEHLMDQLEIKKCSNQKMLDFIYENIKYPPVAIQNNVQGVVVINFVVDKDGSINNVKVARDIGAGCGGEALRVVRKMPNWIPGHQNNKFVSVQFNLPIKFKLNADSVFSKIKQFFKLK